MNYQRPKKSNINTSLNTQQFVELGEELDVPFLKLLGVRCLEVGIGSGEIGLDLKPEHKNTWDVAHGGVLLTLMDVAMALAARSADPYDRSVVTIELKNNFMQAATGSLRVHAFTIHHTATMAFCEAKLYDSANKVCCMASGSFRYLKKLPVSHSDGTRSVQSDQLKPS
jgi:uncharacterized protein (TIGR00369 family)